MSPDEVTELISNMASIASTHTQREPSVRLATRDNGLGLNQSIEKDEQDRKIEELSRELEKLKAREESRNYKKPSHTTHAVTQQHQSCDQCGGIGHDANLCPSFRVELLEGDSFEELNAICSHNNQHQIGSNGSWTQAQRNNFSYKSQNPQQTPLNPPGFQPRNFPYNNQGGFNQGGYGGHQGLNHDHQCYHHGYQTNYGNQGYGQGFGNQWNLRNQGYGYQGCCGGHGNYDSYNQGINQCQGGFYQGNMNQGNFPHQQRYNHQPNFQGQCYNQAYQQPNNLNNQFQSNYPPQSQQFAQPQMYNSPPSYGTPKQLAPIYSTSIQGQTSSTGEVLALDHTQGMEQQIHNLRRELSTAHVKQKAVELQKPIVQPMRAILPTQYAPPKEQGPTHHVHAITLTNDIEWEDPIMRVMEIVENDVKSLPKGRGLGYDFIIEDEPYEEEANSKHRMIAKNWLPPSHEFVLERIDELEDSLAKLELDPKRKMFEMNEGEDSPPLSPSLRSDVPKKGRFEEEIIESVVEVTNQHENPVSIEGVEREVSEANHRSLDEDEARKLKTKTRVYTTPLPFPQRARQPKESEQHERFVDIMNKINVLAPLTEKVIQMPNYANSLKYIPTKKKIIETHELVALTQESSANFQNKMPKKLMDPGSFSIPCMIGGLKVDGALCDSGASVSILPLSIAKKIGVKSLSPTDMTIQLADRSSKRPIGILEDLPVKVGKFFIPTDFVVCDIPEDSRTPIILGRPFMATGGATMNVQKGRLSFNVNGEVVEFGMSNTLKKPMVEDMFQIEMIDEGESEILRDVGEESVTNSKACKVDELSKFVFEPPLPCDKEDNDKVVGERSVLCFNDYVNDGVTSNVVNEVKSVSLKKSDEKENKVRKKAQRSQSSKEIKFKEKSKGSCIKDWEDMNHTMEEVKSILSRILEKLCVGVPLGGEKENEEGSRGYREGDPG